MKSYRKMRLLKTIIFFVPKAKHILLILLVLSFNVYSGTGKIDSLMKVLRDKSRPDTIRMKAMMRVCAKMIYVNPDTTRAIARDFIELAEKQPNPNWLANANNMLALSYYVKGEYDMALTYYETCRELNNKMIASKDTNVSKAGKVAQASVLSNIGNVYLDKGDFPKALSCYFSSLKVEEEMAYRPGQSTSLMNIGMIYGMQGNTEQSLFYLQKSLKLDQEMNNKRGVAGTLNTIGNVYLEQKKYREALDYQLESLKIQEEIGDKQGIASVLSSVGNVYAKQGEALEKENKKDPAQVEYTKALEYQLKGLKLSEEVGDQQGVATMCGIIGGLKNKFGQYDEAVKLCTKGFEISTSIGDIPEERDACQCLYEAYKAKGKTAEAFKYFERYISLRDTLGNEERTRNITRQQFEFEYAKKATADSVRTAEERKTVSLKLTHEKQQRYGLYGGLLLVLVFAGFMFNRFKVTQKQNGIIEFQKNEVETKQKEILDSIQYANRIQKTVLANQELLNENLPEHFVFFKPKDIVSGDFYWATKKENKFYLAVCDSTGHGVPGAFMSLLNINFLNEAINEKHIHDVNEVFDHVRSRLIDNLSSEGRQDGMDGVLVCFERLENNMTCLSYVAANISPVVVSNGEVKKIEHDKMPVGKGERQEPFKKYNIELLKGDMLYLFSDGFADQFGGPKGKKFRYKPLYELFQQISVKDVGQQNELLSRTFEEWRGGLEQIDDVTVLGFRI